MIPMLMREPERPDERAAIALADILPAEVEPQLPALKPADDVLDGVPIAGGGLGGISFENAGHAHAFVTIVQIVQSWIETHYSARQLDVESMLRRARTVFPRHR